MTLQRVGTVTCPECCETAPAFRRGFRDPLTNRTIYAVSLHWIGTDKCPGSGQRVQRADVTMAKVAG